MTAGQAKSPPIRARDFAKGGGGSLKAAGDYRRRGACPGLFTPIETGDGLLVRMRPRGTISLAAFGRLAAAALEHGNGIVEVTARGAIQVRGLNGGSAPRFAAAVAALGIEADDGIAIVTDPLAGVTAHELVDALELAGALRGALTPVASRLARKISVAIDGGSTLGLDSVAADIRLRAVTAGSFRLSVDGDAASATELGVVGADNAVEAVTRLLKVVAEAGCDTRVRDILRPKGPAHLTSRIADLLIGGASSDVPQRRSEAIGPCPLRHGAFAYGVGLPFGHAAGDLLQALNRAAQCAGACGWRTAQRTLLAIGLARDACGVFAGEAAALDFVVRADDPRRRVIACAGAPACSCGHIAARALAPRIAAVAAALVGARSVIHLSGCAKGCAHPAPAALTVVGTADGCALIKNGTARAQPYAAVAAEQVPAAVVNAMRERRHA
jgi:precorrin-3B synthase